jgi:hypothetical protein
LRRWRDMSEPDAVVIASEIRVSVVQIRRWAPSNRTTYQ